MAGTELGAGDRLVSKTNRVTSGAGLPNNYKVPHATRKEMES